MTTLPDIALSVRQPWAWAIVFAGKDIENRSWSSYRRGEVRQRHIAVHAAAGMTRFEYQDGKEFMRAHGIAVPAPADLARGGIIGSVEVVRVVKASDSPWFMGPRGLLLQNAAPSAFIPARGELGFFRWRRADDFKPPPARWMLPARTSTSEETNETLGLFDRAGD